MNINKKATNWLKENGIDSTYNRLTALESLLQEMLNHGYNEGLNRPRW